MARTTVLSFGQCQLTGPHGPLYRDEQIIPMRAKSLAVLWHLVGHAGEILSKRELIALAWNDRVVSDGALAVCIREIRQAIDDDAHNPTYIQTVHGYGYRFINQESIKHTGPLCVTESALNAGRQAELQQLQRHVESAANGQRQVVFVTGEPGIGKTTLINDCERLYCSEQQWLIGHGQCIKLDNDFEVYLPLLEALEQICRSPHGRSVLRAMYQHAPSWVLQLPGFLDEDQRRTLTRKSAYRNPQRMLRELADLLDVLTETQPIILVLEDLHWSDTLTAQALDLLARRQRPARLLILASYRPAELVERAHPLKSIRLELLAHQLCNEIALGNFDESAVADYLACRFGHSIEPSVVHKIYQQTEGHPLYLVGLVDSLNEQNLTSVAQLECVDFVVPEALRHYIEAQFIGLSSMEQQVLDAASVVGKTFTVSIIASALKIDEDDATQVCEELSTRGQFLVDNGLTIWPDGTSSSSYAFCYALYANVLYERLGSARRAKLHRRIGNRLQLAYAGQTPMIANVLAHHFRNAGDTR